jgi:predicted ATPase
VVSEVERIAADHGFMMLIAWCRVLTGWAEAERGRPAEGIARINDGLARMRELGTGIFEPEFAGLLAGIHAQQGELDRARILLDQAINDVETSGQHYYDAELMRRRAELIATERGVGDGEPEELLHAAVALAGVQGARSFQLRAATSLARLQIGRGRHDLVSATLSSVYSLFEEGQDTHDIQEAKRLLDGLTSKQPL